MSATKQPVNLPDDLIAAKRPTLNGGIVCLKRTVLTFVNASVTDIKRGEEHDTSAIDGIFDVGGSCENLFGISSIANRKQSSSIFKTKPVKPLSFFKNSI